MITFERLRIFWIIFQDFIVNKIFNKNINALQNNKQLDGKVVVITGANSGIGKETALQLSFLEAKVIIGCRNLIKAENAINDMKERNPKANITAVKLDLSSLTSIHHFCNEVHRSVGNIDLLINNAGICACPESTTQDGFEMQFGTNYLGHFLLTTLLLPLLRNSTKARIINVSSDAYKLGEINFDNYNLGHGLYTPIRAYAQSKLASVLFTKQLAKRLGSKSNITAYCLTPGSVKTDAYRHEKSYLNRFLNLFLLDVGTGCQTVLYCALNDDLERESGFYYKNCQRVDAMHPLINGDVCAERLWNLSNKLVNLDPNKL